MNGLGEDTNEDVTSLVDVVTDEDSEDDDETSDVDDTIESVSLDAKPNSAPGLIQTAAAERAAVMASSSMPDDEPAAGQGGISTVNSSNQAVNAQSSAMSHADEADSNGICSEKVAAPLSAWLMPELEKVAETLNLLRSKLPNSTEPNSWQIEDAIYNALIATRRVADQCSLDDSSETYQHNYMSMMIPSPSDTTSVIDVTMNNSNNSSSNSEYQTLSKFAHHSRHHRGDGADYQRLAIANGLTPPDEAHYEEASLATSDEDEYDRLAYEFPIHPSMRKRIANLPPPPPPRMNDSDDDGCQPSGTRHQRHFMMVTAPRPQLVDTAVGDDSSHAKTADRACNTFRVLNISRPVQAVEMTPAKFSKHVQTHVLVMDKCVGEDAEDDYFQRTADVEVQTDDVHVSEPKVTEDSWGQTEDKFREDVSVGANMLRDFGQSVGSQTNIVVPDRLPVANPTPLVIETAQKMQYNMPPQSPRSNTPTRNSARRQFSSASSTSGSARSPSSASNPPNSGCYQLFVRIDPNSSGQSTNTTPQTNNIRSNRHINRQSRFYSASDATSTSSAVCQETSQVVSDIIALNNSSTILSPLDTNTLNSSTLSPPTSDNSQGHQTSSPSSNELNESDRPISPRGWRSPIQITGPSDSLPQPTAHQPVTKPKLRRATVNPSNSASKAMTRPPKSGQLTVLPPNNSSAYKSLIKISEGSPPEIRQTSSVKGEPSKVSTLASATPGQLTQLNGETPNVSNAKQVTKIIHRLQRDPSMRAWCSVDNLLRNSNSREDLLEPVPAKLVQQPERAISPPAVFRDFGELNQDVPVDCGGLEEKPRYPYQQVVIPPPKTKQLSMTDVNKADGVVRETSLLRPSKRNNSHHQLRQLQQSEGIVCLARRALVTVGTSGDDSDQSVMEPSYEKLRGNKRKNNAAYAHNRRSAAFNYAAFAAITPRNGGQVSDRSASTSSGNSNGGSGKDGSSSVFSRLSNFLHLGGNSKQKQQQRAVIPITSC